MEIKNIIKPKKIVEISRKYFLGASTQRIPERIQTLGDIELETKINIEKLNDAKMVLNHIKTLGFSKVTHRTGWHHFFSNNLIVHNVLILLKDSNEVWIKIKKDRQEVFTPNKNYPILLRHEKKMKPQDVNYQDEF